MHVQKNVRQAVARIGFSAAWCSPNESLRRRLPCHYFPLLALLGDWAIHALRLKSISPAAKPN